MTQPLPQDFYQGPPLGLSQLDNWEKDAFALWAFARLSDRQKLKLMADLPQVYAKLFGKVATVAVNHQIYPERTDTLLHKAKEKLRDMATELHSEPPALVGEIEGFIAGSGLPSPGSLSSF